jgi:glycine/D-amino acid oxidase-like deaminating enzyme
MTRSWDVIVAGAGIVGAACAMECARQGLRTAILEAAEVGGGATAAGMGHIVVMDDSPAQLALTRFSQSLWQECSSALPADVEYEQRGTLWIAADDEEMAEVRRKHQGYGAAGIPTEILDAQALADAEPQLVPMAGALLVPGDAVLYPPCAARYLVHEALRSGAELHPRCRVASAARGTVRLSDGSELHSAHIVIAGGADAVALLPELPVRKRKGHLVITDRYPGLLHHQLVELGYLKSAHSLTTSSVAFNLQPRKTGQILIGSSRQFDDEASSVDHAILAAMIERARAYMPEIGSLSAIRVWTGFRAATPDKLPLIGAWSADPTLLLATGHEGLGITTSLATARLVLDHILGRTSEIPLAPYLPERFAGSLAHA